MLHTIYFKVWETIELGGLPSFSEGLTLQT